MNKQVRLDWRSWRRATQRRARSPWLVKGNFTTGQHLSARVFRMITGVQSTDFSRVLINPREDLAEVGTLYTRSKWKMILFSDRFGQPQTTDAVDTRRWRRTV